MPRILRAILRGLGLVAVTIALLLGVAALYVAQLSSSAAKDYPPTGRFLTIAGTRLHYIDTGHTTQDAPTIVLIHGNPGSVRDHDRLIPALALTHRVIAIDRPGHGYTERLDVRATPTAQATRLHAALAQLGIERPLIVGHSWGGAVALAYALAFPDDVAGIALLGTRAYPTPGPPDALYVMLRRPIIGPVLRHTLVPILGRGTLEARMTAAYRPDTIEQASLAAARALWLRPSELAATVWDTELLQTEAVSLSRRYSTLAMPVMILVGDEDSLLPESEQLADQLPNAWIEVLPNTGHYLPRVRVADVQRSIAILQARIKGVRLEPPG